MQRVRVVPVEGERALERGTEEGYLIDQPVPGTGLLFTRDRDQRQVLTSTVLSVERSGRADVVKTQNSTYRVEYLGR